MIAQEVKRIISSLSEDQRKDLLDSIKLHNGLNMLLGRKIDVRLLNYAVALLKGQEPDNPLTYRKPFVSRCSKVKVYKQEE